MNSTSTPAPAPSRRSAITALAAGACAGWFSAPARADTWPTRPVTIVVPFPPGGAADGSARVLAQAMAPQLGQAVVVENRPGAGSVIGTQAVVQSHDGHTLLMGSTSMTILPALRTDLNYDVQRDLQPIGLVSKQPLVLSVATGSALKTLDGVVMKGRSSDDLTAGNSGVGSLSHLTTELFNLKMGTHIRTVPYKGESALMPDIVSGVTTMAFLNLPSALPLIKSGRLRALAVTSGEPLPVLTGIPTLRSLGLADFVIEGWAALFAAKDVPSAGVERIDQLLRQALADSTVQARFEGFGVTPAPSTPAALRDFIRSEIARWKSVIVSRGIKLS